jgi:rare lipoprotein A
LKCAALVAVLLAACSGQPARTYDTPSVDAGGAPKATQRRGGGYYKDDGPADDIPDNLDAIPDAQPVFEPLHRFANRPYVVLGKSYVPATQLKSYRMRGIASWYGKKFHGQKTSIGETYDMFSMTAAHPTLPLPSYVRVTSVGNGRSVVVRVNDRGPFHANRIIDLSYAAAYRLGYINNGSTLVDVEAILPGESGAPVYGQTPAPPARRFPAAAFSSSWAPSPTSTTPKTCARTSHANSTGWRKASRSAPEAACTAFIWVPMPAGPTPAKWRKRSGRLSATNRPL